MVFHLINSALGHPTRAPPNAPLNAAGVYVERVLPPTRHVTISFKIMDMR
jgi:hypothetical protein